MASITLEGVSKSFGSEVALRDCHLEIGDHEFLVLVGPSGSGKTTLLRIVSGLETATAGDIYFGDRLVNDVDVGDRDIAMVFQNYGLYPHMSVHTNMAFGLRKRKMEATEIERRVTETAGMLGIEHLLSRKPKQLSGGQRQRVALGRAIVRDPAVFLLDEPLSNLDAHLRVQMRAEILKVHRAVTATAVYVTHDQVEALTMGDRIAVMHEGVIQQVDTPEALYDNPVNRFVGSFIGTPSMGQLPASVVREGDRVQLQGPALRLRVPEPTAACMDPTAREVTAGIRPEHLRLVSSAVAADEESTISGTVEVVEPLGSEQHVVVDAEGSTLTARLPRADRVELGQKVTFAVDVTGLHVFDAETGLAYRPGTTS